MRSTDVRDSLRRCWAYELTEETTNLLIAHSRLIACDAEHVLFGRGDDANGFYIVLEGQVRF
jgi:CRP-like cAMP-binding protein